MRGGVPSVSPVRGLGSESGCDRGSEGAANVDEMRGRRWRGRGAGMLGMGLGGGSEG